MNMREQNHQYENALETSKRERTAGRGSRETVEASTGAGNSDDLYANKHQSRFNNNRRERAVRT